jgi:hypothetical protein
MRLPPSVKLVVATWIAALIGALAGRSAAVAYGAPGRTPSETSIAPEPPRPAPAP